MDYESGSQEAGIKMDNLRQQAEALATAAYESSTAYQGVQAAELDLIGALRENTATVGNAAWMTSYRLNQELSKGQASTYSLEPSTGTGTRSPSSNYHRYATGLGRVPYNNFPAFLDQDERVLTASEARAYREGGSVTISGNTFVVRQESDIDAIAAALLSKLRQARLAGAYG